MAAESLTESRRALFGGLRGNGKNRSSQKLSEGIHGESGTLDRESTVLEHGGRSDSRVRTGIQADSEAGGFEGRGARGKAAAGGYGNSGTGEQSENSGLKTIRDLDYLRKSLEQIAACREKSRAADENWLRDLRPEEVELIGDILKQYLV